MAYTAPTLGTLNHGVKPWPVVLHNEFVKLQTVTAKAETKAVLLTAGMGTRTALATSGVDLASGSDAVYYGVFFAPVAITAVTLEILGNEVYLKNSTPDAAVILKDNAGTPNTIFTQTITALAAGGKISVSPQTGKASIADGTRLDLFVTSTGGSGTGYVDVILKYTVT